MPTTPPPMAELEASRPAAGVRGLLNFAPVRLVAPESVHVEYIDVTMALEKVAYFARDDRDEDSDEARV